MASAFSLLLLLLLHLSSAVAQTVGNVTLGTSLSAGGNQNSFWASPSGDFAFGFQPLPGDQTLFLLAIWFDNIPEKTIVWCANSGNPVKTGSRVEFKSNGQLRLYDHENREIWKPTNVTGGEVANAAMLDTGNFVLASRKDDNNWESFSEPTDTILPTQTLRIGTNLSSRVSETDYRKGRFQLLLQEDSALKLCQVDSSGTLNSCYWGSDTTTPVSEVVFIKSGDILLLVNGTTQPLSPKEMSSTVNDDLYYRATLDFSGTFKQFKYPKTQEAQKLMSPSWSPLWSKPSNPCLGIRGDTGSGACGYNSYCKVVDTETPTCECPHGFTHLNLSDKNIGCKPIFPIDSCMLNESQRGNIFGLEVMVNTDWPLSDFELNSPVDEEFCRKACLDDCFCVVAIFRGGSCWKKRLPLSNGIMDSSIGGKAIIKVVKNESLISNLRSNSCAGKKERTTLIVVGSLVLGSSAFLNFLLLSIILLVICYSHRLKMQKLYPNSSMLLDMNLRCYSYRELEDATAGFKEELGRGAFGSVYKGVLLSNSKGFIAVKKLDDNLVREDEKENEFKAEVSSIGETHHKNLVRLLGYCDEGSHRLLVYEFMSNGSLASFLFRISTPDWVRRMQIVFGIARGLVYLHHECSTQIVHCDIKPENILLDKDFNARISDFGLAKLLMADQTRTFTGIRGTKGYVAPEWFRNKAITVKVDVYSFGVMLLEIICCRKNVEPEVDDEKTILTDWAYDCYVGRRLDLLVEKDKEAMNEMRKVERLVMIAIWCIQEDPSLRPSMNKVTQMLEGVVQVSVPPDPSPSTFK